MSRNAKVEVVSELANVAPREGRVSRNQNILGDPGSARCVVPREGRVSRNKKMMTDSAAAELCLVIVCSFWRSLQRERRLRSADRILRHYDIV